ncbi:fatty acid desaturase [Halobacteriovorax sp. HLS]|uniref:fatty acid desaturase n=1 Tax=Halobacteriovorax sp. HLS TaxID=2234000 RepID=UPI000FD7AEB9|nr:fatty acid desaturase [Halobacteriovorax sp. HLS]
MTVFNYKEDRLPVLIISTYFLIDILIYLNVQSIGFLVFWFFLGIWPKGNICSWNHHHQHCQTFKIPLLNRILELMYGLQTGVFGFTWVLHHNLGHHLNYLDQHKDESRWKDLKGQTMGRLRYTAEVSVTSYARAYKVGKKHPKILKKFIWMAATTLTLVTALTFYRPIPALLVFWIPMIVSLILTADATYSHHTGLDTQDPVKASRNIVDSVWYNRLTGNLGYHTAHHIKFGLHWSKTPMLHEKLKADIPPECYGKPMFMFRILDWISKGISTIRPFGLLKKA